MASACGPEMPTHATIGGFNDATVDHIMGPDMITDTQIKANAPPNPPFVFPAKPSTSPAPPMFPRTSGRRPMSAIESSSGVLSGVSDHLESQSGAMPLPDFSFNPGAGSNALPSFSFNPGAGLKPDIATLLSPPLTPPAPKPAQPNTSPSRPPGGHRHRRGGSEFVGGSIRMGDSITVTSFIPNKGDIGSAPGFLPPPNRRGHTRNRSANPSIGSTITLQPVDNNSAPRGTSAPTSPSDVTSDENVFAANPKTANVDVEISVTPAPENPKPTPSHQEPDDKAPGKARVGFSDTLEFIPRPVSLISSDTSSTATVRPSHSFSGSVSSLISMSNSIVERDASLSLSRTTTLERSESRPSTAGAVLDRTFSSLADQSADSPAKRRNSIPALITVAPTTTPSTSEPSPSKAPKRWSFFGLEPFASSPTRSRPTSSASNDSAAKGSASGVSSSDNLADVAPTQPVADPLPPQTRRAGKKNKKKVKKWAGAILTRKAKPRAHKSAENLSTTARLHADPDFGADIPAVPKLTIRPPMPVLTVTEPQGSSHDAEISRPVSAPSPDDDISYPVIDLDAALGPFNTPLPRNPEWEAAQQAALQATKRPLHSAQGMKGFSGPGMHYHRRTESAPEMVPFEGLRGGLHRFGSRSTMADVFEEDEEDIDDSPSEATASQVNLSETPRASLPDTMSSVESETDGDVTPPAIAEPAESILEFQMESTKPSQESFGLDVPVSRIRKERSTPSLRAEMLEYAGPIAFRTTNLFMVKGDGDGAASRRKDLAPVEISPLQTPPGHLPPTSPYSNSASSYPSPRSPMSYDAQIISTAPSSVNEDTTFQSLLLGEPGPEVRISVDDIPSLTSSTSATTRDSMFVQNMQMFQNSSPDRQQRPVSLTGPFGRRRSSLASLSRLISSAHGERSKLSSEVSYDNDEEERPKSSRAKRLSRLMQFWKPKEPKESKEAKEPRNVTPE